MTTAATQPSQSLASVFPTEAQEVLRELRRAIGEMFDHVPGGVRRSRDVQKLYGVSTKLSWQIFKLAGPGDAMSLVPHVPKAAAMRGFLDAAEKHGAPVRSVNKVRAAYSAFEELIETHAGDRTSFDSMARGLSGSTGAQQTDVQHRKAIFRGHSHFWGCQVETRIMTHFMHPAASQQRDRYDLVAIRSKFGLRRLRADAEVVVDSIRVSPPAGGESYRWEYLDPEAAHRYGAPIMTEASTQPVPQLRTTPGTIPGRMHTELSDDALGRRGAVNLAFGQVWRDTQLSPSEDGKTFGWTNLTHILTPTALFIEDMLVHRPSFPRLAHEFQVYGHCSREDSFEFERTQPRLPFRELIIKMEGGADDARIHGIPQYHEMLAWTCDRLNWRLDDFDVYRVRIEYPLLDTLLSLRFDRDDR
jgi:hypothetical protein